MRGSNPLKSVISLLGFQMSKAAEFVLSFAAATHKGWTLIVRGDIIRYILAKYWSGAVFSLTLARVSVKVFIEHDLSYW